MDSPKMLFPCQVVRFRKGRTNWLVLSVNNFSERRCHNDVINGGRCVTLLKLDKEYKPTSKRIIRTEDVEGGYNFLKYSKSMEAFIDTGKRIPLEEFMFDK